MGADHAKEWKGGSITIGFERGANLFSPGQVVKGTVRIMLTRPCFPTRNITVGLYGSEQVHF